MSQEVGYFDVRLYLLILFTLPLVSQLGLIGARCWMDRGLNEINLELALFKFEKKLSFFCRGVRSRFRVRRVSAKTALWSKKMQKLWLGSLGRMRGPFALKVWNRLSLWGPPDTGRRRSEQNGQKAAGEEKAHRIFAASDLKAAAAAAMVTEKSLADSLIYGFWGKLNFLWATFYANFAAALTIEGITAYSHFFFKISGLATWLEKKVRKTFLLSPFPVRGFNYSKIERWGLFRMLVYCREHVSQAFRFLKRRESELGMYLHLCDDVDCCILKFQCRASQWIICFFENFEGNH